MTVKTLMSAWLAAHHRAGAVRPGGALQRKLDIVGDSAGHRGDDHRRYAEALHLLTGNWSQAVTERSTLSNETTYSRARYDISTLTGYDELANVFTWTYAWSGAPMCTPALVHRYEPEQDLTATASNSYTPAVGVKYQLAEGLSADAHIGVNQVSGDDGGRRGEGGVALHRPACRCQLYRRAQHGGQRRRRFRRAGPGAWCVELCGDRTDRVGADAAWQDSKGQSPNTLQTYSVWASRQFSPYWDLRLSLMYKERQQDHVPDATATIVGLTLTYRYPDI
jgi:hypothetical protein